MTDGVLLIHAFPMDATMWGGQKGDRRIAPDLPGFGGSAPAGETMTMAAAAERCVKAMDQAKLDRAVVCGLSMGGYVAFELWRSAPSRIAGLVLANTRSGADTPEAAEGRRALAQRLRTEGNGFLVETPPPLLRADASDELWGRVRATIAAQPAEAIAAAALGMAARPDSTPDLPGITVPTLVITSEGDTLIPADVSSPMAEQIPGARLEVLADAGHLSNLEEPGRFGQLLDEHVVRCGVEG